MQDFVATAGYLRLLFDRFLKRKFGSSQKVSKFALLNEQNTEHKFKFSNPPNFKLPWLTLLPTNALLAALASPYAPLALSAKAKSITSIPTLALSVARVPKFVPAKLSFRAKKLQILKFPRVPVAKWNRAGTSVCFVPKRGFAGFEKNPYICGLI